MSSCLKIVNLQCGVDIVVMIDTSDSCSKFCQNRNDQSSHGTIRRIPGSQITSSIQTTASHALAKQTRNLPLMRFYSVDVQQFKSNSPSDRASLLVIDDHLLSAILRQHHGIALLYAVGD